MNQWILFGMLYSKGPKFEDEISNFKSSDIKSAYQRLLSNGIDIYRYRCEIYKKYQSKKFIVIYYLGKDEILTLSRLNERRVRLTHKLGKVKEPVIDWHKKKRYEDKYKEFNINERRIMRERSRILKERNKNESSSKPESK